MVHSVPVQVIVHVFSDGFIFGPSQRWQSRRCLVLVLKMTKKERKFCLRESCQREAELSGSACVASSWLMELLPTAVVGRVPLQCSLASQLTGGGRIDGAVSRR